MREIRLSGLEGGETQTNASSLPLSLLFNGDCSTAVLSRLPTSFSLTLLSSTFRLASQARHRDD